MESEECVLGKEEEKEKAAQLVWLVSCLVNREFKKQFTQMLTLLIYSTGFSPPIVCGRAAERRQSATPCRHLQWKLGVRAQNIPGESQQYSIAAFY